MTDLKLYDQIYDFIIETLLIIRVLIRMPDLS